MYVFAETMQNLIPIWRLWKLSNFQSPLSLGPSTATIVSPILNDPPLPQPPHHGNKAPWNNAPCMLKNKIKTKTKPSHVTFKLATRSISRISPQIVEWLDKSQP